MDIILSGVPENNNALWALYDRVATLDREADGY
jgi:hypothetical protein